MNDLAFAGPSGFKLYKQQEDSTFTDVTPSMNLSPSIIQDSYYGSWAYDLDLDGDLDLLLSSSDGDSKVLRNNGDGTFDVLSYFNDIQHIRDFLWADFDRDGDPDAVILTADGQVQYYRNERSGEFLLSDSFVIPEARAIDFGDLDSDGVFEIISWHSDQLRSTAYSDSTGTWNSKTLVNLENSTDSVGSFPQLFVADLDNNGALDLMISDQNNTRYWLSDETITLTNNTHEIPSYVYGLSDMNQDTRLDLFGLTEQNQRSLKINSGSQDYKARILSPRASTSAGDQRINSFGIGGEIESRSGLQYLRQPIDKPWIHIGLGTYEEAEMVRIIWPNGSTQAEFAELGYDTQIMNEQILKGSCQCDLATRWNL